jgi:hypothetical protein
MNFIYYQTYGTTKWFNQILEDREKSWQEIEKERWWKTRDLQTKKTEFNQRTGTSACVITYNFTISVLFIPGKVGYFHWMCLYDDDVECIYTIFWNVTTCSLGRDLLMFWSNIVPQPSGSKGKPSKQKAATIISLSAVTSQQIKIFKTTIMINSNPTFVISFFWMSVCLI